ncbi:WbqC family protein [Rheinheimera oceanensis]|uniref:WbqC family protein n=1 Tax=Rheinheimera oceanensis TaxID=2817449 RepID=UPI001BFE4339|nr:WbqC family protein [Rheinheimera oceanensis]
MITVAVCQSNYMPWKGYFDMIRRADYFVFYDIVQYTKNDWRNRNKIQTPAGPQWLTVPVLHRHLGQPINQIELAGNSWQAKHWKTLQQNYRKAAYFDRYAAQLEDFYRRDWRYLSDLNQSFITLLCELLQIKTTLVKAESLQLSTERNQRLLDICQHFNATHYLSGPAAQAYLDTELFKQQGITVQWMQYQHYPPYPQLQQPFEHAVTVLDLLFNTGPDALAYL